jgi:hypothetical protein
MLHRVYAVLCYHLPHNHVGMSRVTGVTFVPHAKFVVGIESRCAYAQLVIYYVESLLI